MTPHFAERWKPNAAACRYSYKIKYQLWALADTPSSSSLPSSGRGSGCYPRVLRRSPVLSCSAFCLAQGARRARLWSLLGRSSQRVATSSDCTGSLCKTQDTKQSELGFSAVLGSGASEVRFERTMLI